MRTQSIDVLRSSIFAAHLQSNLAQARQARSKSIQIDQEQRLAYDVAFRIDLFDLRSAKDSKLLQPTAMADADSKETGHVVQLGRLHQAVQMQQLSGAQG